MPTSETRFEVGGGPTEVEFVIDQAGAAMKLLRQGDHEMQARRKPKP